MFNILIKKVQETVEVDFDNLPEISKQYLIEYGLKQRLNDCHSSLTLKDGAKAEDIMQAVHDCLAGLQAGTIRKMREASSNAFENMVQRVILETLRGMGTKSAGVLKTLKAVEAFVEKHGQEKVILAYCQSKGIDVAVFHSGVHEVAKARLEKPKESGIDISLDI